VASYSTVTPDHDLGEPASSIRRGHPLLRLQEVDLAIDRLSARLAQLEAGADLRRAREGLSSAEDVAGSLRLALDSVGREHRRLEGDIDSMTSKIEAERRREFDGSVANPKELQSIEAEIRNIEGRRSRTEDLLLEQMEKLEDLQARLAGAEEEVGRARSTVEEIEGTSASEVVELERSLAERREAREALVPQVDDELLELYEELRVQKRGVGAAALVNGICQACNQQLSPVYLERLRRTDGVRRCEHCRRILIFT
jgi:predicted  nucleic acid-binding Zn-ribbon protein